jgi:hypothetical protein
VFPGIANQKSLSDAPQRKPSFIEILTFEYSIVPLLFFTFHHPTLKEEDIVLFSFII